MGTLGDEHHQLHEARDRLDDLALDILIPLYLSVEIGI
jgi:hypothetical protein